MHLRHWLWSELLLFLYSTKFPFSFPTTCHLEKAKQMQMPSSSMSADFYDVRQFQVISIAFSLQTLKKASASPSSTLRKNFSFRNRQRIRDQISPPKLIPSKKWACQITEGCGIYLPVDPCELVDCCRDNRVIVLVTLLHLINVSIATIHLLMDVILTFLLELLCM